MVWWSISHGGRDCYGHTVIASAVAVTLPRIGKSNKKNEKSLIAWLSWIYDIKSHYNERRPT